VSKGLGRHTLLIAVFVSCLGPSATGHTGGPCI